MNVHENVILDLLPAVRNGTASAESRQLVEQYLEENPQIARFAALMPTPDPGLELRALERTRKEVARVSWQKGLAIFFSLLPLSIINDGSGLRFLFADYPLLMFGSVVAGLVLWINLYQFNKRSSPLR